MIVEDVEHQVISLGGIRVLYVNQRLTRYCVSESFSN